MSISKLEILRSHFDFSLSGRMPIELPIGRNDFAALLSEMGCAVGAEIGVERGEYSDVLLKANPFLFLFLVDSWKPYEGYREHVSQAKMDGFLQEVRKRLPQDRTAIIQADSHEAAGHVFDNRLDFVYIDANHDFFHVTQDIQIWSSKVRRGGIIAGHDFRRVKGRYVNHVKDVVQAWTYSHGIRPWFICRGDRSPTWFWIKQ